MYARSIQRQGRGISLVELLFVLVIASALILLGISQYKRFALQKDLKAVRYNVSLLLQAVNLYYRINYSTFNPVNVTRANLKIANLWPNNLVLLGNKLTPNDADYGVAAEQISGTPVNIKDYRFIVKATLHLEGTGVDINWYKNVLNATDLVPTIPPNTLRWIQTSQASISDIETNLWISKFQQQQSKNIGEKKYSN